MKLAFSSGLHPSQDIEALAACAAAAGCRGFELCGLYGHVDIGPAAAAVRSPDETRRRLEAADVRLCALDTAMLLGLAGRRATAAAANRVRQALRLAAQVGCRNIIVRGAPLPPGASADRAIARCAEALASLAEDAERLEVCVLLETSGVVARSDAAWYACDAAASPFVRICLNPVELRRAGDNLSVGFKRLGGFLELVRMIDGRFEPSGFRSTAFGEGEMQLSYQLELLKGMAYRGWLCIGGNTGAAGSSPDSAGAAAQDVPTAEAFITTAAAWLRMELEKPVVELTAYKGDKNAPRFRSANGNGRPPNGMAAGAAAVSPVPAGGRPE